MSYTVAIIQARMGSTRLPGKVLEKIGEYRMLDLVVKASLAIPGVDSVVVATTTSVHDQAVLTAAEQLGVHGYAGSEEDVLDRYYQAALLTDASVIVRVTADCPLLDQLVSGKVLERFKRGDVDYASNCHPRTYPDGLDTEVLSFNVLEQAWREASLPSEREHVTPFVWTRAERFRIGAVTHKRDLSSLRWTVDEPEDLEFIRAVLAHLNQVPPPYRMEQVLQILASNPGLTSINSHFRTNEGYTRSLETDGQLNRF